MAENTQSIEVFPWNQNFETGIPSVDEQHKKLVDLLNRLAISLAYETGELEMHQVIGELAEYANYHFKAEEAVWKHVFHEDDWLEKHEESHNSFIAKVGELSKRAKSAPDVSLFDQILRFLIHWLAYHILDNDMRMAKVLHAMKEGLDLSPAKLRANEEMSGSTRVFIETLLNMYGNLSSRTLELMRERVKRIKAEESLKLSQQIEQIFSDTVIALARPS